MSSKLQIFARILQLSNYQFTKLKYLSVSPQSLSKFPTPSLQPKYNASRYGYSESWKTRDAAPPNICHFIKLFVCSPNFLKNCPKIYTCHTPYSS